jgi:hypothetical protein
MFFEQPFAGPAQFQSSAVDDQVKFARSNPREVANRQSTRAPAQDPIRPSLWRSANRNTVRKVRAVSMARSE